jgi:hypothetical protein
MTTDIRASVTCSLGRLISASVNDDYIQGTGLIKISGSCVIAGLISPSIGTRVTFQYTKAGLTRTVPRVLRVLSSFADPFRRTTTVELGCKLTYLEDLTDPINWSAFDDPRNTDFEEDDQAIVVIPISAISIAEKCLQELGLQSSPSAPPLTNSFSIPSFDFSSGYVNILSDLLVSESYCGYLDTNEVLQIFSLDQTGGTGPLISEANLLDVGSIGVGDLPGDAVTVSYSTLKLREPDPDDLNNPELGEDFRAGIEISVIRQPEIEIELEGEYRTGLSAGNAWSQSYRYAPSTRTTSYYDSFDRIRLRKTVETSIEAALNPGYITDRINYRKGSGSSLPREKITTTNYIYRLPAPSSPPSGPLPEGYDEIESEITTVQETELALFSGLQFEDSDPLSPFFFRDSEIRRTDYSTSPRPLSVIGTAADGQGGRITTFGNVPVTTTRTSVRKAYAATPPGLAALQVIAEDTGYFAAYSIGKKLIEQGTEESITTGRESFLEIRPNAASRAIADLAEGGDPNNGYRTESSAELELSVGSETAQRRIELSMPYAPDDKFIKTGSGTEATFSSVSSDAPQKAKKFGLVQNRMLLGNRSGMNIQIAPERMPSAPFSPIFISARSLTGLYRTNGTTWTMDSNGILCSTDAMFWGIAGAN